MKKLTASRKRPWRFQALHIFCAVVLKMITAIVITIACFGCSLYSFQTINNCHIWSANIETQRMDCTQCRNEKKLIVSCVSGCSMTFLMWSYNTAFRIQYMKCVNIALLKCEQRHILFLFFVMNLQNIVFIKKLLLNNR